MNWNWPFQNRAPDPSGLRHDQYKLVVREERERFEHVLARLEQGLAPALAPSPAERRRQLRLIKGGKR